jgi:RNA polymerase sigma-70 factor, ECF subfamily
MSGSDTRQDGVRGHSVEERIVLLRSGDPSAFESLFERNEEALLARIRRHLPAAIRRKVSVSDVLQETRITAFAKRAAFEGGGDAGFRSWLLRIAELKAREAFRHHAGTAKRAAGREVRGGDSNGMAALRAPGPSPSEAAMETERRLSVERALGALPEDYRTILVLTRFEGLSLADAAARMGRSREAAKKLHGRAMARFAREMGPPSGDGDRGQS